MRVDLVHLLDSVIKVVVVEGDWDESELEKETLLETLEVRILLGEVPIASQM